MNTIIETPGVKHKVTIGELWTGDFFRFPANKILCMKIAQLKECRYTNMANGSIFECKLDEIVIPLEIGEIVTLKVNQH